MHSLFISGNLLSPTEILGNLSQILNDTTPKADHPIGVLTCQNRDDWAIQRTHLDESGNRDVLQKIDSAIFNLVLDDEIINDNKHKILHHYLHGDGTNRYFILKCKLIIKQLFLNLNEHVESLIISYKQKKNVHR